jgi:hypothetical protein
VSEIKQPGQKLVEVTVQKPHTHAGVKYQAGAKVKVNEAERDWLAANKIIETPKEVVAK